MKTHRYQTTEEMRAIIDAYFEMEKQHHRVPVMQGVMKALGFKSRKSLKDTKERGEEWEEIIQDARMTVEYETASALVNSIGNVTGHIFTLKNNFGWKDKQEVEHSGNFKVTIPSKDADTL